MHYLLFYSFVEDILERRAAHRDEHLRLARESQSRGELVLAGALAEPADGAVLVFRAADRSIVERFAEQDPYVVNGLVTHWRVRPWTVAIGG